MSHSFLMVNTLFICAYFTCGILAQNCYDPDGSYRGSTDYQPCNNDLGTASMCCATNRTNPDECLSNGLCRGGLTENSQGSGTTAQLWRESCTDPTWTSPECLHLCIVGQGMKEVCKTPTWLSCSISVFMLISCFIGNLRQFYKPTTRIFNH